MICMNCWVVVGVVSCMWVLRLWLYHSFMLSLSHLNHLWLQPMILWIMLDTTHDYTRRTSNSNSGAIADSWCLLTGFSEWAGFESDDDILTPIWITMKVILRNGKQFIHKVPILQQSNWCWRILLLPFTKRFCVDFPHRVKHQQVLKSFWFW